MSLRISLRFATATAMALIVTGCAWIDPNNILNRNAPVTTFAVPVSPVALPPAPGLTRAQRETAFDFVWATVNDRYYDPKLNGVDWKAVGARFRPLLLAAKDDEAFWDELDRMTGELRDAHTRVHSPKRAEQIRQDESVSLGFAFIPLEGRLIVSAVSPDSDAWWAGVRSGMTLVEIEREEAGAAFEKLMTGTRLSSTDRARHFRAVGKLSSGDLETKTAFTFERSDGTRFGASLKRRKASTAAAAAHRVLPSGYGYLRLTQWTGGAATRVIEGLREMKDIPGMIVDLRGNPGGSLHAVERFMEQFFPQKVEVGRALTRSGKAIGLFMGSVEVIKLKHTTRGNPEAYTGPMIVLVNAGSGSGSEYFSGAMQALGRATVMGEPTCGCLLGFLGYATIPGGGEIAYSEVGFVMANGKRIEGEGVIPDAPVAVAMADLRLNRDRTLEEAQSLLKTLKPWPKDAKAAVASREPPS